jgi:eukaryotic-like serine/threonine-protein kinase
MALRIGRYILHDEIASGGMAAVHFGRLVGTGGFAKTVAIKRLHKKLAREDAFRTMILEEARLAARIRHPNVVPPLDVLAEGSELLLVMEYVHGEALSKLLRAARDSGERVPVAVAAAILTNVLHGLHAAHEARGENGEPLSIVHRDVSPQNVIVGVDGVARVIDFGIAKAVTSNETTNTGTVKGKLPYLSPEQLEGEPVTRRTDVYAAGIVLWEVLTTKRLFEGVDDSAVLRNILSYQPPPPSLTNPSVPGLIDEIALRALSKKPADRFASAREMALAIEEAIVIATPSVVGGWAERLAERSLARRAELIARLEQSDHDEIEEAAPPSRAPASRKPASIQPGPPSRPPPPSKAPPRAPSTARAPPKTTLTRPIPVETVALAPEIQEDVIANTETREISLSHAISIEPAPAPAAPRYEPAGYEPSPYIIVEPETPPAPATPQRTIGATLPVYREPEDTKKPFAYFLVAAALFLLIFATPFILARSYVAIAARHGFLLTIERVEVSRRSLRLVDVHLSTPELPGAALSAHSVTLGGFLRPSSITFDDALLELDGRASDVWTHLDALREARAPGVQYLLRTVDKVSVPAASSGRMRSRPERSSWPRTSRSTRHASQGGHSSTTFARSSRS